MESDFRFMQQDIALGLAGAKRAGSLVDRDLNNDDLIGATLYRFVSQHDLIQLSEAYARNGEYTVSVAYSLQVGSKYKPANYSRDERVVYDGQHRIVICKKSELVPKNTIHHTIAQTDQMCISFNIGMDSQLGKPSVDIVQIQSLNNGHRSQYQDSVRWELMLANLTTSWAFSEDFEVVRIQPAEMNIYYCDDYKLSVSKAFNDDEYNQLVARNERLRMRYNVTAKRAGFKMGKSGYFELHKSSQ